MKLHSICLLITIAVSGCDILSGKCTYEVRSFNGHGNAIVNGGEQAAAQVILNEDRGSITGQTFNWLVTGSLKGHVTSASFKDSTQPTTVLLDLPVLGADRMPILEGVADSRDGATLGGFHDVLAANHGVIELQTDDPANPTVDVPVTGTNSDWLRPNCS